MNSRRITVWALVTVFLLAGAGPAIADGTWLAAEGVPEPNTPYDSGTFMPQHPNDREHPNGVAERIYFNGFLITSPGPSANLVEGSPYPSYVRFAAYLGYWRDCNGDGYVGAKSTPATPSGTYGHWSNGAYPADAYDIDRTLCAPGSAYNTGLYVDEFRWIGPNATPTQEEHARGARFQCNPTKAITIIEDCTKLWNDMYDVTDREARVWADWRRPDAPAAATRPVFPAEMFDDSSSTIEIVNFALRLEERLESRRTVSVAGIPVYDGHVAEEGTWDNKPSLGACDEERTFGGGPEFVPGTGQGTCGLYPLWQAHRLYSDERGEENATPLVTAFDKEDDDNGSGSPCDDTSIAGLAMADVEPEVHEDPLMHGSIGGTLYRNVFPSVNEGGVRFLSGECGGEENPPGLLLSSAQAIEGKDSVDSPLAFNGDERLRALRSYGVDNVPVNHLGVAYGARWTGTTSYIVVTRVPGLESEEFTTLYADVSPDAFTNAGSGASAASALPAGTQDAHTYGDLQCGGNFEDTPENRLANAFGWFCSRELWASQNYYPGRAFDFRDVDCYDQSPSHTDPATESPEIVLDTGGGPGTEVVVRTTCASWHTV